MSAGSQGGLPPASVPMRELIKDAAIWALVALGLCFPLIAFRTDQNFSHQPVLDARPYLVALFVIAVFAGRLLWRLYSASAAPAPRAVSAARSRRTIIRRGCRAPGSPRC